MLGVMAGIEQLYLELRNRLLARRQRIAVEIACHPRPITGCDVHFNSTSSSPRPRC
jgi:hypothetical protein